MVALPGERLANSRTRINIFGRKHLTDFRKKVHKSTKQAEDTLYDRRVRGFQLLVRQLWGLSIHGSHGQHVIKMREGVPTLLTAQTTIPLDIDPAELKAELDALPIVPDLT